MNVAWYGFVFDAAVDTFWERIGHTAAYRQARQLTTFAVESHTRYLREIRANEDFSVSVRVIDVDSKRIHQFQSMYAADDGRLVATCEWMHLHVNLATRRVAAWEEDIAATIRDYHDQHRKLAEPEGLRAAIGIRRG